MAYFFSIWVLKTSSYHCLFRMKEKRSCLWIMSSVNFSTFNSRKTDFVEWNIFKFGGLDSRDQSRSRSRTSFVSRLTFFKCRDYPSRRDQLFFSRSRFLKLRFFSQDLSSSRYLSRSSRQIGTVEIFEICRDFLKFIEISQHYRDFLRYFRIKNLDKLKNLDRELW
jgi:hypothetical protein